MDTVNIPMILKEEIANYTIISAPEDKSEYWRSELEYAVRLGNAFKGKTTITFETTEGPKMVQTTVWSVTEKSLQLKAGVMIPLKSVIDVHF